MADNNLFLHQGASPDTCQFLKNPFNPKVCKICLRAESEHKKPYELSGQASVKSLYSNPRDRTTSKLDAMYKEVSDELVTHPELMNQPKSEPTIDDNEVVHETNRFEEVVSFKPQAILSDEERRLKYAEEKAKDEEEEKKKRSNLFSKFRDQEFKAKQEEEERQKKDELIKNRKESRSNVMSSPKFVVSPRVEANKPHVTPIVTDTATDEEKNLRLAKFLEQRNKEEEEERDRMKQSRFKFLEQEKKAKEEEEEKKRKEEERKNKVMSPRNTSNSTH